MRAGFRRKYKDGKWVAEPVNWLASVEDLLPLPELVSEEPEVETEEEEGEHEKREREIERGLSAVPWSEQRKGRPTGVGLNRQEHWTFFDKQEVVYGRRRLASGDRSSRAGASTSASIGSTRK